MRELFARLLCRGSRQLERTKPSLAGLCLLLAATMTLRAAEAPQSEGERIRAIAAPRPDYPSEARRQHMVGRGTAILEIDLSSGKVTQAYMEQSTGYALLDSNTLNTLRHWRFQAGTIKKVRVPINYTMQGEVVTTVQVDAKPIDQMLAPFLGRGTVLNGPMPQYPRPWSEKHGEGLYELRIGPGGGAVKATVLQSSHDPIFDQVTVAALRNWRLNRGPMVIELPLSFHLTNTKYSVGIPKHP